MKLAKTAGVAALGILAFWVSPSSLRSENYLFIRGDFHADGTIDVSDALAVIFYLFRGPEGSVCLDAGDVDDDSRVDVADAVSLLQLLFAGGPAPAAPFPECGPDPSFDLLHCDEQASCPPVVNEIVAIRRTNAGIEIEVSSSAPFPVRALAPILCIGLAGFHLSRGPSDGGLNRLIFSLTEEEFRSARPGDLVTVQHSDCTAEIENLVPFWDLWVFGPFDPTLLGE